MIRSLTWSVALSWRPYASLGIRAHGSQIIIFFWVPFAVDYFEKPFRSKNVSFQELHVVLESWVVTEIFLNEDECEMHFDYMKQTKWKGLVLMFKNWAEMSPGIGLNADLCSRIRSACR